MNKVHLVGNVGAEPESAGKLVKGRLATNDGWGDNKKTNWHSLTLFGKAGESFSKYVKKGSTIAVTGRVEYSQSGDKWYTNIVVEDWEFVGKKEGGSTGSPRVSVDTEDVPFMPTL